MSIAIVIANHPNDYFLFMVDENLDVEMEDVQMKHSTISGSLLIQSLRQKLLPDQEAQVLTLIRSANDSKDDVAIYNSRAHGFFAKAPVKKEIVREKLAQHWLKRFPKRRSVCLNGEISNSEVSRGRTGAKAGDSHTRRASESISPPPKSSSSAGSSIFSMTDLLDDPVADVVGHMNALDTMVEQATTNGQDRSAPGAAGGSRAQAPSAA